VFPQTYTIKLTPLKLTIRVICSQLTLVNGEKEQKDNLYIPSMLNVKNWSLSSDKIWHLDRNDHLYVNNSYDVKDKKILWLSYSMLKQLINEVDQINNYRLWSLTSTTLELDLVCFSIWESSLKYGRKSTTMVLKKEMDELIITVLRMNSSIYYLQPQH